MSLNHKRVYEREISQVKGVIYLKLQLTDVCVILENKGLPSILQNGFMPDFQKIFFCMITKPHTSKQFRDNFKVPKESA